MHKKTFEKMYTG